jgi:hypothetical protein
MPRLRSWTSVGGRCGGRPTLRQLLHEPPKRPDVATRSEALHLLSQSARDGRVQAQVALARELREAGGEEIFDWVMEAD